MSISYSFLQLMITEYMEKLLEAFTNFVLFAFRAYSMTRKHLYILIYVAVYIGKLRDQKTVS